VVAERVLVIDDSAEVREVIRELILEPAGYLMLSASDGKDGLRVALDGKPDLIILDEQMPGMTGVQILQTLREQGLHIPVIFMTCHGSEELAVQVFRLGALDYVIKPFEPEEMTRAVERALDRSKARQGQHVAQLEEANQQLRRQVEALNTLAAIGRSVASLLDLDTVLTRVAEAAAFLTQAEEGLLLLAEKGSGDLVLRAAKNVDKKVARQLRIRVQDPLAGRVMESGEPLIVADERTKVATGYLVSSLIYAPLRAPDKGTIGILGVTNRESRRSFTAYDVHLVSTLADYAAMALENARLYGQAETERQKLQAVLRETTEGVIILDPRLCILLCNPAAAAALGLSVSIAGREALEVISHLPLRELLLAAAKDKRPLRAEVEGGGGKVYSAQLAPVEEVGYVLMLQDVTRFKELDRVKSEVVSTISHDLRTPLTTVQGYVSLLEKAGPLNDQQRNFVVEAQKGIAHITKLIDDILELGRIEAGYDLEMEPLHLESLIETVIKKFQTPAKEKKLQLRWMRHHLPLIRGNPRRLRQALENLVDNAVKYTLEEGWVAVEAVEDDGHIVVRVADSGIGIPLEDQPHIFERFYRVQTAQSEQAKGTGLGLAIVKSVIEKHGGRIWMESRPGKGSVFTFILHTME